MHKPLYLNTAPILSPLWGRLLAGGMLWLLVVGGFVATSNMGQGDADRSYLAVAVDLPQHLNSEQSLSLQRLFKRYKDQPKPLEPPEPIWLLTVAELMDLRPCVAAGQFSPVGNSPFICLQQLQTLNIPRAPPLV